MSSLNVHAANSENNRPTAASEYIASHWATVLRVDYRRLRKFGVPRAYARSIMHGAYCVGLNAGREEAHQERLAEFQERMR